MGTSEPEVRGGEAGRAGGRGQGCQRDRKVERRGTGRHVGKRDKIEVKIGRERRKSTETRGLGRPRDSNAVLGWERQMRACPQTGIPGRSVGEEEYLEGR